MSNIISFKDNKYTNVDSYNNDNKNINDDCDKLSNSIKTNNNNNGDIALDEDNIIYNNFNNNISTDIDNFNSKKNFKKSISSSVKPATFKNVYNDISIIEESSPVAFTTGLYNQLLGKNRQKSKFYNTLLLACFNMNIAHLTFPFLSVKLGIFSSTVFISLCLLIANITQKLILNFLTLNKCECNYGSIIEMSLGNSVAYFVEALVMIWYIGYMIVSTKCLGKVVYVFISPELTFNNEYDLIIKLLTAVSLFVFYLLLNKINKNYIIDFYVFICLIVQFASIIVRYICIIIN